MFNPVLPLRVRLGRAEFIQSLISAGYLLLGGTLIWLGWQQGPSQWFRIVGAMIIVVGAAFAWHASRRRAHLIADTPTTRIRSAAQGYVEVVGEASLFPGQAPLAFNGLPPCVWFEVVIADAPTLTTPHGNYWVRTSDEVFMLRDDTGCCVVDPDHAEIHSARQRQWSLDGSRYRARYLMVGDTVHVMGELRTMRAHDGAGERRAHVAEILRMWKQHPKRMLQRFDRNRDGDIDTDEYQEAVKQAEQEVRRRERELRTHPDVHLMQAPQGDYPFILSDRDPHVLAQRFKTWSLVHTVIAIATAGYLVHILV